MLARRPNSREYTVNKIILLYLLVYFIKRGDAISLIGKGESIWEELREG